MRYRDEASGLYFDVKDDKGQVAGALPGLTVADIPETFEGHVVDSVAKKAFLGCKQLRSVKLPGTVTALGDWAFARCDSLQEVRLPGTAVEFGKGVFEKAVSLKRMEVAGRGEDTARLLAGAVRVMDADYLLDCIAAGSEAWLRQWDQKLIHILDQKDDEGYHLYVLCGEEDLHFDYDEYLEYNRRKKAGLSMLRLLNDRALQEPLRERITDYILTHTVGSPSGAAWDHVTREHGDDVEYFELLTRIGAIDRSNLEQALADLGRYHAQAKAYLMGHFSDESASAGFYDDLLL